MVFVAAMCMPSYANGVANTATLAYKFARSFDPWVDYTDADQDVATNVGTQQMNGYLVFNVNLDSWELTADPNLVFYGGTGSNKWVTSFGVNDDTDDANGNMDISLFSISGTDSNGLWFTIDANTEQEHVGASYSGVYGKTSRVDIGKGSTTALKKHVPSSMKGIVEGWATDVDSFEGVGSTTMTLNTLYTQYANKTADPHTQPQTVDKIIADLQTQGYLTVGALQAQIDAALAKRTADHPGLYPPLTINVAAGTYVGDLVINEPNVTLKSTSGKTVTIIQLVDVVGINIITGADNFTLDGFTIVPATGATNFPIQVTNGSTGVTIANNIIDISAAGIPNIAINVGAAGAQDLTITGNTIKIASGDGGIWGPDVVDVTVSNNTISGPTAHIDSGYGIQFSGIDGTSLIRGNTLTNCGKGMHIFGALGGCGTTVAEDVTISYNTIKQCEKGIYLGYATQTTNMKNIFVNHNTLQNNVIGLYIPNNAGGLIDADTFDVNDNKITGNTTFGVQNLDADILPAEDNWWGFHGPYHAVTNPAGIANNPVSDNVDYSPYRANSAMTYSVTP